MSITEITEEINKKSNFSEISIEEIAPHGKWAFQVANSLGDKMKTHQLRKVFNELKRIEIQQKGKQKDEVFNEPKIYLIIPQLAYARARDLIGKDFYDLIKTIIGNSAKTTKLKKVEDYRRFIEFMTAIVAYHKK